MCEIGKQRQLWTGFRLACHRLCSKPGEHIRVQATTQGTPQMQAGLPLALARHTTLSPVGQSLVKATLLFPLYHFSLRSKLPLIRYFFFTGADTQFPEENGGRSALERPCCQAAPLNYPASVKACVFSLSMLVPTECDLVDT